MIMLTKFINNIMAFYLISSIISFITIYGTAILLLNISRRHGGLLPANDNSGNNDILSQLLWRLRFLVPGYNLYYAFCSIISLYIIKLHLSGKLFNEKGSE